jgi:hypothetical protein
MGILTEILGNTSPWEILLFLVVIYLFSKPNFRNRITKIKFGEFELELEALRNEVQKGTEKIAELEDEVESDKRLFEDILDSFDPNSSVRDLASARQAIKAEARNLSELESLRKFLVLESSAEELFVAAVTIREKRPVALLPDLIAFLEQISSTNDLGGYRLNTIWTLISALHRTLIACIRDGVEPTPSKETFEKAKRMLVNLDGNVKVQNDRPDNPMKGIRGPAKHALNWVNQGLNNKQ